VTELPFERGLSVREFHADAVVADIGDFARASSHRRENASFLSGPVDFTVFSKLHRAIR
jgi:hypothetical protein